MSDWCKLGVDLARGLQGGVVLLVRGVCVSGVDEAIDAIDEATEAALFRRCGGRRPESDGAAAKAINWLPPDCVAVVIPDVAAARVTAPGAAWPTAALGSVTAPAVTIIPPL